MTAEQELITRLARGDRGAFRELVETHKRKVYFHALDMVGNPADAEDISQEVFLKVFRSFGTFKRDAKIGSWLYRITYNACIDYLRKKALTPVPMEDTFLEEGFRNNPQSEGLDRNPAVAAERELLQEKVRQALAKVSPQERAVFLMHHQEEMSLREVAEVMDISIGSVKCYLFRAVRKLQKELIPVRTEPEVSHE